MAGKSTRAVNHLLREVFAAFDPGNRHRIPVGDLPNILKCVGLGPDDIPFSEVEELRQAIDPGATGFMTFDDVKRVVGRELVPDFPSVPFERLDMSTSLHEQAGTNSGELSRAASASRRPRSRSLVRSPVRASPERARLNESASTIGLTSDDTWKQFKKFDLDKRGVVSEGDLIQVNAKFCNSFLTEAECAFVVDTLRSSKYRGGITLEDFRRAIQM